MKVSQSPYLSVRECFQQQEEEKEEAGLEEHKRREVCAQLQGHLHGRERVEGVISKTTMLSIQLDPLNMTYKA